MMSTAWISPKYQLSSQMLQSPSKPCPISGRVCPAKSRHSELRVCIRDAKRRGNVRAFLDNTECQIRDVERKSCRNTPSYVFTTCKLATCRPIWYLRLSSCQYRGAYGKAREWSHSSLQALPPRISNRIRECCSALPALFLLTKLTISGAHCPSSFNRPT